MHQTNVSINKECQNFTTQTLNIKPTNSKPSMPNPWFQFKQFTVFHDHTAMKVTTDACLFGAWCADEIQKAKIQNLNLLDIGTGTGLLSLMVAQKNKIQIDAIEIDEEAAAQAGQNISSSPWTENIKIFNQDILNFNSNHKYEAVISNPPFYENELASGQVKKDLAHHSLQLSLVQLFSVIKNNLADEGRFFLLLPFKRENEIEDLLNKHQFYIHKKILVQQSTSHQPFRVMLSGSDQQSEIFTTTISIKDEKQQYTQEFTALLEAYYLYL